MAFIRSVIHALWMFVTVVPWGIYMVTASIWSNGTQCGGWRCAGCAGGRQIGLGILGIDVRVSGYENLPLGERSPAILLVKHQSTLETFLMPALMPHPLAYVFKKELFYIPFFGWAMGRMDMIHIDRRQRAQAFNKVVAQGKRLLRAGRVGHHVPGRHAHSARQEGPLQVRRHPAGRRHGRAGDPDRGHFGQGLAAQGLHQAAGRGRCVHRQAHPQRRAAIPTN